MSRPSRAGARFLAPDDMGWQLRDDAPPSCRVPTDIPEADRIERFRLFDVAGAGGRAGEACWVRIREAVKICQSCPVQAECLAYAKDPSHRVEGVWGGYYFDAPEQRSGMSVSVRTPRTPPPPRPGAEARTRARARRRSNAA